MAHSLDTEALSAKYRERCIDVGEQRLLVTRLAGSAQEKDLTLPPNCGGFGRVRHFRRETSPGWPDNPLPIDPAAKALGIPSGDLLQAQVFQNAACNWRCWYCFVPFELLAADPRYSGWKTARELVDLYLAEDPRPRVIDLSGGQPDLVPEWIPWMMRELRARGLHETTYLWSDDNLSNDYFWNYLTPSDLDVIRAYPSYGRVACFKGFDAESFAFNTLADESLFQRQFDLYRRFLGLGVDLYAYATFTTPNGSAIAANMARFVDQLMELDRNLPLRTIPLEIHLFAPVRARLNAVKEAALANQQAAIEAWVSELEQRFSREERSMPITEVCLGLGSD